MSTVLVYCSGCARSVPFVVGPMRADSLYAGDFWTDVVCPECGFVITSIAANEPGVYAVTKVPVEEIESVALHI